MTNTQTLESIEAQLTEWRKTWTFCVREHKSRGERISSRHLPQDLATCNEQIGRLEMQKQLLLMGVGPDGV